MADAEHEEREAKEPGGEGGFVVGPQHGRPPEAFTLVDDASPNAYTVEDAGRETVRTARGPVEAVALRRGRPGDKRVATFWFAPKFGFIPVQIVHMRKGRETLRMTLIDVAGEAAK